MDEADLICAHNGDAFDIKKINSRLIVNGFKPPSPFKTIDTLKIARRVFKFDSNKLDNIGRYLSRGPEDPQHWRGALARLRRGRPGSRGHHAALRQAGYRASCGL
jgi:DNA polymerase III epsilon subunit-like protein